MSEIEWSSTEGEFYTSLSVSTDKKDWYCYVEIDSQTIACGCGKTDTEAMGNAISDLDVKIQELLQLKSSMVWYLINYGD